MNQPEIETIAEAAGVTSTELHHLFRRWAGLTPKAFLQAITLDRARALLRASASVLDTTFELGLVGPARLHDLFVTHEAMSPGEWKSGGAGLTICHGFHPSPFGSALVMATERGLAGVAFADAGAEAATLADMRTRWPRARCVEDPARTEPLARRIFDPSHWRPDRPLRVVLIGTDFEVQVWEALLKVPLGHLTTYFGRGCSSVQQQGRTRRRGRGRKRKSAGLRSALPSRQVIGRAGNLTGYHWGLTRKRAMLGGRLARSVRLNHRRNCARPLPVVDQPSAKLKGAGHGRGAIL